MTAPRKSPPARKSRPRKPRTRVETLSADELTYHAHLIAQKQAADAAWSSWVQHLVTKYALGAEDGITEHGQIVRSGQSPTTT